MLFYYLVVPLIVANQERPSTLVLPAHGPSSGHVHIAVGGLSVTRWLVNILMCFWLSRRFRWL